ncbi:MAG: hypothetical protein ACI9EK_003016 [Psychroserpens sp.]|jgi:hypothetical protein
MAKKTIFISYDYDNDKHYKNLLVAWDKNDLFDFKFYDSSVDVSVNSTDANYIKQVITNRIKNSNQVLVIVGAETNKSGWVKWEINKAHELGKKLIAVKTNSSNTSPDSIFGKGASWSMSFTFEGIRNAIES